LTDPQDDPRFPHLDERGRARMVDVSSKASTARTATARAVVRMSATVCRALWAGELWKGDGLATVRLAAIQAAKETQRLIPLCHPLALTGVDVDVGQDGDERVVVTVTARCQGPTGVEMEAMTGAAVGALALYDMCKGMERGIQIERVELLHKAGGRSGEWRR
jgi:cyclic pyranopterin phosphate synthase